MTTLTTDSGIGARSLESVEKTDDPVGTRRPESRGPPQHTRRPARPGAGGPIGEAAPRTDEVRFPRGVDVHPTRESPHRTRDLADRMPDVELVDAAEFRQQRFEVPRRAKAAQVSVGV